MKKVKLQDIKNNGKDITVMIDKNNKVITNRHGFVALPLAFEGMNSMHIDSLHEKFIIPKTITV